MDHLIWARRPGIIIINKNKRTWKIVDFAVPADHRVKLEESEKKDKYLDLARELKKLWYMKVTFIPNVIGDLCKVTKRLLKRQEDMEIRGRVETNQTTALLRTARILKRVMETLCHINSSERPCKKLSTSNYNYNNNVNTDKRSTTTSYNDKTEVERCNMLG